MNLVEALHEQVRDLVREELRSKQLHARYVSKEKLAELLGVRPRTLKTWRSKGLPGIRVGREVMFELHAVEHWIEGHA